MDLKKVLIRDVHRIIPQDYSGLYSQLQSKFGDDNPFARFQIGGGFYVWSDPSDEWLQMIGASVQEQDEVRRALQQLRTRITSSVGEKSAEALFQVPDDSFIYYKKDGSDIKILITGWGFKYPVIIIDPSKNSVGVRLMNDGEPVPNTVFERRSSESGKTSKSPTDANGYYRFKDIKPGTVLTFVDLMTHREFNLIVEAGKKEYEIDTTLLVPLQFAATLDAKPIAAEHICVKYHGKTYDCETDAAGCARLQVPYHKDCPVEALMRDTVKQDVIAPDGNAFTFEFESPVVETYIRVIVKEGDEPVPGHQVHIAYHGDSHVAVTNDEGVCDLHLVLEPNATCEVSTEGYESISKSLTADGKNLFVFNKAKTIVPPYIPKINPYILIVDDNGSISRRYPITVEYDGQISSFVSDENGIVEMSKMTVGKPMRINDGIHEDNTQEYTLEDKKLEYVFHIPSEPNQKIGEIRVMMRNADGSPIVCEHVLFKQGGNELELQLNADGDTSFAGNAFLVGPEIMVSIVGAQKDYPPISFTLEENENEYLIQEVVTKSRPWIILIELLLVLLAACLLIYLFPYLSGLLSAIYDFIY